MGRLRQTLSSFTCVQCRDHRPLQEFLLRYSVSIVPQWGLMCVRCRVDQLRTTWPALREVLEGHICRTGQWRSVDGEQVRVHQTHEEQQKRLRRLNTEVVVKRTLRPGSRLPAREVLHLRETLPSRLQCGYCREVVPPWAFPHEQPLAGKTHCLRCFRTRVLDNPHLRQRLLRWPEVPYLCYRRAPEQAVEALVEWKRKHRVSPIW